ncbi:expressed unknown protein [Seminavis robusta]|uniref:DUF6824 domain-containing protein n=1 Tax=Seminavis robusta TaxID=568900 RepID=A0A9N8HAY7_9STRA|nr:expressed unknown protein [Seminavis robusta]|eukprot:Sro258_g101180.1 n/a (349) ;mRNA; f:73961-75398
MHSTADFDNTTEQRGGYPMSTIFPGKHDLLLGRGGETNNHSGNINFRGLIQEYKQEYQAASKGQKPAIAKKLVKRWRNLDPPGRFLAKEDGTERWVDIGDEAARRRTSKSLGEKTKRSSPSAAATAPSSGKKRRRDDSSDELHRLSNPSSELREPQASPNLAFSNSFEPFAGTGRLGTTNTYGSNDNLQLQPNQSSSSLTCGASTMTPQTASYSSTGQVKLQGGATLATGAYTGTQQAGGRYQVPSAGSNVHYHLGSHMGGAGTNVVGHSLTYGGQRNANSSDSNTIRSLLDPQQWLQLHATSLEDVPTAADLLASNVFASSSSSASVQSPPDSNNDHNPPESSDPNI